MSHRPRLTRVDAGGALLGALVALWGVAQFSIAAAAIAGGVTLAIASLASRRVGP